MPDNSEKVCVVIVNYNAGTLLQRCLSALKQQSRPPDQVTVVDNGSRDGSTDGLEAAFPWVQVLRLGRNLGFAEANNIAVRRAETARWVALLNPDAFPDTAWLERMLSSAREHPQYSFFGSRLLDAENGRRVDGDGDVYHVSGAAWRRHYGVPVDAVAAVTGEVFAPCAAAALYRRDAFLEAGGFDRRFFCYFEDVDLAFRLRLAGHRAWQVGDATVHHLGSGITGSRSDFTVYHGHRNLVWTYVKNMPGPLFWRFLPQHLLFNLVSIMELARRGQPRVGLRAKWDALKGLPEMWRDRRRIQADRRVTPQALRASFLEGWLRPYSRDRVLF
jgi:GT2 family glycosyltransferase